MNHVEFLSGLLRFKYMLRVLRACGQILIVVMPSCFFKIVRSTLVKQLMVVATP
jgi:hypothetical protein